MWTSPEHFKTEIRAAIEDNQLPLTRVSTPAGFVMAALRRISDNFIPGQVDTTSYLFTISSQFADRRIVVEEHVDQTVINDNGGRTITKCIFHCGSYWIADDAVTHMHTGDYAVEGNPHRIKNMFSQSKRHDLDREALERIWDWHTELGRATPEDDVFRPANFTTQNLTLDLIARGGHMINDPAAKIAIASLRPGR